MEHNVLILITTAISIAFIHTLAGPDHYLPFVAMSKSCGWSRAKTANVVILCGIGHVLSSVVLGFIGIVFGMAVSRLQLFEGVRGNLAAWFLFIFGVGYTIYGIYHFLRHRDHTHTHGSSERKKMTFWILFTIFIFGPCEPLIPILMYPAATHNFHVVALVSLIFAIITIATMLVTTFFLLRGVELVRTHWIEKYQHIAAGSAISLCGAAVLFLGL